MLAIDDVAGTRWLESPHAGKVKIPEENAAAALEVMSRFAVDPRWLVYLPPTMSPVATSQPRRLPRAPGAGVRGVRRLGRHAGRVRGEAHGLAGHRGHRAGRRRRRAPLRRRRRHHRRRLHAHRPAVLRDTSALVDRLRTAAQPLFESLDTDWLALDCELLPWSAKALELIKAQYASVGAAARHVLPEALSVLEAAAARGLDVGALATRTEDRLANAHAFRDAYAAYVRPTDGLDGITLAPFQVLAAEGRALAVTESHEWHLDRARRAGRAT